MRFELGTFEREMMRDKMMIDGLKAVALPLSAALVGLGLAGAGFFAYNKIDDLKDWVADNWEDGFGLVNDPVQTQEQVTTYSSPNRTPATFSGMATSEIYRVHYDMRDDLCQYFSRLYAEQIGYEQFAHVEEPFSWTGETHELFKNYVWVVGALGTDDVNGPATFRFERPEVIQVQGEDVNEISEYTYQMIIRETDSRNTQARVISGVAGAVSTGIGAAFSEATHWALRSSGFMRGTDGWDGQNWEEAPGANKDPLLMYAWGRTDFQTGKWWSTVDSQGDIAFWLDVNAGLQGAAYINAGRPHPENFGSNGQVAWSYEQIIYYAHQEMQDGALGNRPFLRYISESMGGIPYAPILTEEELEAIEEEGEREQQEQTPEGDTHMPGEEPDPANDPTKEEYWRARNEQPPPGWRPS